MSLRHNTEAATVRTGYEVNLEPHRLSSTLSRAAAANSKANFIENRINKSTKSG